MVKSWPRVSILEFPSYIRLTLEPNGLGHACPVIKFGGSTLAKAKRLIWAFEPNNPLLKTQIGRSTLHSANREAWHQSHLQSRMRLTLICKKLRRMIFLSSLWMAILLGVVTIQVHVNSLLNALLADITQDVVANLMQDVVAICLHPVYQCFRLRNLIRFSLFLTLICVSIFTFLSFEVKGIDSSAFIFWLPRLVSTSTFSSWLGSIFPFPL